MIADPSNRSDSVKSQFFDKFRRFSKDQSGVVSTDFVVVAALSAAVGVMMYSSTLNGSGDLVTNTGFVIGPDGPNYSIDGSGPILGDEQALVDVSTSDATGDVPLVDFVY